ncbi:hypothetical protein CgunFtcFv8_012792 [Champsocephalus gunnari]|uniref:Uncharacterized protein n=1 Tax=Champsocephalus gunnari TaxID=52237 RepID=A0AAN8DSV9_CHAGU|nr:hypothetical protein CgunFtcFv8_012792 [Champsocephalus gunnari]
MSRPTSAIDNKLEGDEDNEKDQESIIDGKDQIVENNRLEEEDKLVDVDKDNEGSEDSDSQDQRLLYDFASATVKVSDDEDEARLTSYVPLENSSAIVSQTRVSSDDLNEEPTRTNMCSSPPTVDQHRDSDGNASPDDEALPQTDIDDVDVVSPDEAESLGMNSQEVRNIDEPVIQKEDSTGDEDDDDQDDDDQDDEEEEEEDEQEEEEEEEEEEEDVSDDNEQLQASAESLEASAVPETEVSKDKKRDFLSELGLEQGEEEQDSWDSESHSENPKIPQQEKQSSLIKVKEEVATVEEDLFYTPSFLREEGGNRILEPRRSVGRPRGSQGEVGNNHTGDNRQGDVEKDDGVQKETEKSKWEPLRVLSKLEADHEQQTDLMEELGLGDVDDLEDASDWDSASTASKRTLPGRRMPSPGLEESPECTYPPKEQEENLATAAPPTTPRSINPNKTSPSTPPQPVPQPQPRAKKMVPAKPESEEESDWEQDNVASTSNTAKVDNQLQNLAELQIAVTPGSPELPPKARDTKTNEESDQEQQKEVDGAVDICELDLNNSNPSGHAGSDDGEKDHIFKDQPSYEERGEASDGVPWENRYEKLWVEVEKREVKSTFKNVAGELKEKFGELLRSRQTAEVVVDEEQATAESTSADEESSDEDEDGEVIVRPTARARSTVLLTIPEQRESGQEDSLADSTDNSLCDDLMQVSAPPPT